jgi:hypothetical protein
MTNPPPPFQPPPSRPPHPGRHGPPTWQAPSPPPAGFAPLPPYVIPAQRQGPPEPEPRKDGGLAVASLTCAIVAFFWIFADHAASITLSLGLAAMTCGILALRLVSHGIGGGRGMAIWGLVLGVLFTLGGLGGLTSSHTGQLDRPTPPSTGAAITPTNR